MADRGFDIIDSVEVMKARLHIPAFTKGKKSTSYQLLKQKEQEQLQLSVFMWNDIQGMSGRNTAILQNTLPIHNVHKRDGEDTPLLIELFVCVVFQ